jgi:hypothetical protein
MASNGVFSWSSSPKWRIPVWSIAVGLLTVMGGAVGARSNVLPRAVFTAALVWAILAGIIIWAKKAPIKSVFWLRYGFFILLGGGWVITLLLSR